MTEEGEALRRRLYRPGAADADLAAYLAVAGTPPERDEQGPQCAPRRPRRVRLPGRRTVAGAVVLAALLGASALALRATRAEPPVGAGPTPLPTHAVPAPVAARFEAALARGDDAGLGAWWDSTDPFVKERGSGDGTVQLPVSGSGESGRLTVLLMLASDGTAGWSAARLVIHDDRTIHLRTEASASGALRAGVPAIGRLDFSGPDRPVRLFVQAAAGTRWGVAAIISG